MYALDDDFWLCWFFPLVGIFPTTKPAVVPRAIHVSATVVTVGHQLNPILTGEPIVVN